MNFVWSLLIHLMLSSIVILVIARKMKGVEVDSWWAAFCGAVTLGVINAILYPVAAFITLPFTVVTFGLFLLILHACMFI